jgi:capsular polysaccharide biosynthesis protein
MTNSYESPPPETSLIEAVWRFRWSSLFIVVLCGLLAVGATEVLFRKVQATAKFAVTDPQTTDLLHQGVSSGQNYGTYTAQRAAYAQSASVLERAAQIVAPKGGSPMSLQSMRTSVSTVANPAGGIVVVTATASDMPRAAGIANAVVQSYEDLTAADVRNRKNQLLSDIQGQETKVSGELATARSGTKAAGSLSDQLTSLRAKESALVADITDYGSGVQFVDQADPSEIPPSKVPVNGVIGLAVGLLIACVVAFLRATTPQGWRTNTARGGRRGPAKPRRSGGLSPQAETRASRPYPAAAAAAPLPDMAPPRPPAPQPSSSQAAPPTFGRENGGGDPTITRPERLPIIIPDPPEVEPAAEPDPPADVEESEVESVKDEDADSEQAEATDHEVSPETQRYVSSLMRYTDQDT